MKRVVWLIVVGNLVAVAISGVALAVFVYGDEGRRSAQKLRASLKPGMTYAQVEGLARRPGTYTVCEGRGGNTPCESRRLRISTEGWAGGRWYFIGEFDGNGRLVSVGDITLDGDSDGPG